MKNQFHFLKPPAPIRRARLDNVALVPGNLLAQKLAWQRVANRLPPGAILIILPSTSRTQREALLAAAKLLAAAGHQVRVIPATELARRQSPVGHRQGM